MEAKRFTNTNLKVMRQALDGIYSHEAQVNILEELLKSELEDGQTDRGVSVLTSVFYKGLFKNA